MTGPTRARERYRAVFQDRIAGRLFLSGAVSGLGDWIGLAGLVVIAYERSGSAVGSAALFACQGAAAVVSTLTIAAQIDRFDRGRALAVTYLVGAGSLAIPVLIGGLWPVLMTAVITGLVRPTASALRHAIIGVDLDRELINPVVSLQKGFGDIAVAAGLASGGAITIALGPTLSLGLDAAAFGIAAVLVISLVTSPPTAEPDGRPLGLSVEGYRIWLSDPVLRLWMGLICVQSAISALPEVLAPAIAGDGPWLPVVLSSQAAGTAVVGLAIGHRTALERPRTVIIGTGVSALGLLIGAAVTASPAAVAGANLLLGFGLGAGVLAQSAFTKEGPPERLGAVIAAGITTSMVVEGAGALVVGWVAAMVGTATAYLTAAVGAAVAAGFLLRAARAQAIPDPQTASHRSEGTDTP